MILKLLFLTFLSTKAVALTPKQVVESSLKHYPLVIESLFEVDRKENILKESRGLFDAKLKGEIDSRPTGFYDGDAYKAIVEKSFPLLNSKIYGGMRKSYGSFPSYEGKFETLSRGETFAGLSLSLLRNSLIDYKRYEVRQGQQDLKQAEIELDNIKINVQALALNAYWTWVTKGQELRVYQNILDLAQKRSTQIKRRIGLGDLARIYESENLQYILKRESQVLKSQIEFQQASFYLSLFYRDSFGLPQEVSTQPSISIDQTVLVKLSNVNKLTQLIENKSLELQKIESQKNQAKTDIQIGQNEILPKVDLNFEWNQDQGTGPSRLAQDENRVMLNMEIPIEYNKGLGKKRAGKAKFDQMETKSKFLREKLKVESRSLFVKMNNLAEIFKLSKEQVMMAEKLAKAEVSKFSKGASDLILVNIREENLAEAQIKNLESLLDYYIVESEVRRMTVDFL